MVHVHGPRVGENGEVPRPRQSIGEKTDLQSGVEGDICVILDVVGYHRCPFIGSGTTENRKVRGLKRRDPEVL